MISREQCGEDRFIGTAVGLVVVGLATLVLYDVALQIHGGNGYALEYEISRVLCDAGILNIFEGAAEIQAQVIARGLLAGRN